MQIHTKLNSKKIKLSFIMFLVGVLVVINLFVLNKVISDSGQTKTNEKNIIILH